MSLRESSLNFFFSMQIEGEKMPSRVVWKIDCSWIENSSLRVYITKSSISLPYQSSHPKSAHTSLFIINQLSNRQSMVIHRTFAGGQSLRLVGYALQSSGIVFDIACNSTLPTGLIHYAFRYIYTTLHGFSRIFLIRQIFGFPRYNFSAATRIIARGCRCSITGSYM